MEKSISLKPVVRFGPFEGGPSEPGTSQARGEAQAGGAAVRSPGNAAGSVPGQLVTREELHARLWPTDTFVDFDHGLNAAVNKLRDALSRFGRKATYVETLPRRGYRSSAQWDLPDSLGLKLAVPEMPASLESPVVIAESQIPSRQPSPPRFLLTALVLVVVLASCLVAST